MLDVKGIGMIKTEFYRNVLDHLRNQALLNETEKEELAAVVSHWIHSPELTIPYLVPIRKL